MTVVDTLVQAALMAALMPPALAVVKCVAHVLVLALFSKWICSGYEHLAAMHVMMIKHAYCSSINYHPHKRPSEGWHVMLWKGRFYVVQYSRSHPANGGVLEEYRVYILRLGTGDPLLLKETITAQVGYGPNSYLFLPHTAGFPVMRRLERQPYIDGLHTWQKAVCEMAIKYYNEHDRRCSLLVCGPPGTGKSTLAEIIAWKMTRIHPAGSRESDIVPILFTGLSLMTAIHHEHYDHRPSLPEEAPFILAVDEIDVAVKCAYRDEKGEEAPSPSQQPQQQQRCAPGSVAENPSSLHGALDRYAKEKHTLFVATTNWTQEHVTDERYARCFRPGRFHLRVWVESPTSWRTF